MPFVFSNISGIFLHYSCTIQKKVAIIKILSLFVSLSVAQFHRETTLRTPRELPETTQTEKVRFVKIATK